MKKLLDAIKNPNLANDMSEEELNELGSRVIQAHNDNEASMGDWCEVLEAGIKLCEPESKAQDKPWDNASNYKSQIANQAITDFGDKAVMEILANPDLINIEFEDEDNEQIKDASDRVKKHMNWQVNFEDKSWRPQQERLLYRLAAQGSVFKKTYFDSGLGHNCSELVGYPDFSINNKCQTLDEPHYFTHIRYYTRNEIMERINSELWIDIESMFTDEIENTIDNENYRFLEQITEFDINDDGYAEPVLVTVHEQSGKVVRVMAMWDNDGLTVKYNERIASYEDIIEQIVNQEPQAYTTPEEYLSYIDEEVKQLNKKAKLVCINPIKTITHYRFIDSGNCSLLGYGFNHLMTSSMKAVNKATNSLFNAGDLANLQSGFLSKEHRTKKKGGMDFKPGQWRDTNLSSGELRNSIIPLPVKEPSTVLLQLNEQLKAETNSIGNKTDISEMMSPNIPAASVLGLLQEGAIPTSALLFRVLNSMSEEFTIMYELNARYTDPVQYQKLNDGANYEDDYSEELFIKPTANAKFSNQAQRIQQATAEMDQIPMIMQAGGNVLPIIEGYFDALGSDKYDAVFNKQPSPEEQARMEQMQAAQEQQNQLLQKQNQMIEAELQLRNKELEIKDSESAAKIATMQAESERKDIESQAKMAELEAKIQQMKVSNIKTIQEAEKINAETQATEAQQLKTVAESMAALNSRDDSENN